jgi:hypothetical protein
LLYTEFNDVPKSKAVVEFAQKHAINLNTIGNCLRFLREKRYNDTIIQQLKLLAPKPFEQGYGVVLVTGGNGTCGIAFEKVGAATRQFNFEYVCVSSDCEGGDIHTGVTPFNEIVYKILSQKYGLNWEKKVNRVIKTFEIKRASILPSEPYDTYRVMLLNKYQVPLLAKSFHRFNHLKGLVLNADLKKIPSEIGDLKVLKALTIAYEHSKFKEIPSSICQLNNLESLSLSQGKLKRLPKNIGQLKKLKRLDIRDNKITQLPESICELIELEELFIDGNKIEKLPENIGNLKNLKKLFIDLDALLPLEKIRIQKLFGHLLN